MPEATPAFSSCAFGGDRKAQAELFTSYLDARPKDTSYVANLNAAWGSGKTFFVTEWQKLLTESGYVAVRVDTWESDYLKDPLAILTSEILEQIKQRGGFKDFAEHELKIIASGAKLVKNFLPVLMMALGRHFLGNDYTDIFKEMGIAVKDQANDSSEPLEAKLGDFGKESFQLHQRHKDFAKTFKEELGELVAMLCKKTGKDKVYVFVDELDRCRPTYAIEMLEVVKHLFDIPNLVFILSTDTEQLQCSIKAVYGHEFDAKEYLSRFFNRKLSLQKPDYFTFLTSLKAFDDIPFDERRIWPVINCPEKARAILAPLCEVNNFPFRRVEQLVAKVEAALLRLTEQQEVNLIELIGLIIVADTFPKQATSFHKSYTPTTNNLGDHQVWHVSEQGVDLKECFTELVSLWGQLIALETNPDSTRKLLLNVCGQFLSQVPAYAEIRKLAFVVDCRNFKDELQCVFR